MPAMAQPVNPNATPEAKKLLDLLHEIRGRYTLSGQHNYPGTLSQFTEKAHAITGKYPAIWGQDFGFAASGQDGINHRPAIIEEAIRQHRQGSIVTLMWHAVRPVDDEPNGWKESVQAKLTEETWLDLVTPGTKTHARWQAQVDVIAAYLKRLRDAGVPVLWRPYHEMNGRWFWWGGWTGELGYVALWRLLYHRLVNDHHLDNLIWVWNANAPHESAGAYVAYYPGADLVDVLAADVYRNDFRPSHHDELAKLASGKPIALGEVGKMPTPEILEAQPQWTWFMTWTDFLTRENPPDEVRRLYHSSRVLSREDIAGWLDG